MPAAWPCANAALIALTVEATLAKTIMVSSNIEAFRLERDGVHSTDKTFTIHSRSFTFTIVRLEYQIHAPPRCWGVVMDEQYVQENILTGGRVAPVGGASPTHSWSLTAISLGVVAPYPTHLRRAPHSVHA